MNGSLTGNLIGLAFFLEYQAVGILLAGCLLKNKGTLFRAVIGSTIGSFLFSWIPVLISAVTGHFDVTGHILSAILGGILLVIVSIGFFRAKPVRTLSIKALEKQLPFICVVIPVFAFFAIVLFHHTLSDLGDGVLHCGQSTYGDMSMHLGFITSIKEQGLFPPEYSILPGTRLAYPFLSDSISSSVYICGASLRFSYILPMLFAVGQVFMGFFYVSRQLFTRIGGAVRGKTIVSFVLFFFNGGLGIWYFINKGPGENFNRIFTAFYETPTNYTVCNVQWHNIICDMLLPQRATLFGWAVLFPVLSLLLEGLFTGSDRIFLDHKGNRLPSPPTPSKEKTMLFIVAGVLAGGLPLIHTHSFLALGVLCAGTVMLILLDRMWAGRLKTPLRALLTVGFFFTMTMFSMAQLSEEPLEEKAFYRVGLFIVAALVIVFLVLLIINLKKKSSDKKEWLRLQLTTWGVFLGIVLVCALPQLFAFTFRQAQGEHFLRGGFNWANQGDAMDNYITFYLKNLGIVFVLLVLMLIWGTKKQIRIVMPACVLWVIAEFILFQPNSYDNNKLLLVSYLFICIAVTDFAWDTIPAFFIRKKTRALRVTTAVVLSIVVSVGSVSAVLTMGREYVSDFELFGRDYVELCEWIEKNTKPEDIILTSNNHNNAVAALTGRNIVCGTGTFLFFHGLDYGQQEEDERTMYEDPSKREALLAKYNVDYILIGPYEYGNFQIPDMDTWIASGNKVYEKDGFVLLKR